MTAQYIPLSLSRLVSSLIFSLVNLASTLITFPASAPSIIFLLSFRLMKDRVTVQKMSFNKSSYDMLQPRVVEAEAEAGSESGAGFGGGFSLRRG